MTRPIENKRHRVPTGAIDRRLAVSLDTSGPLPELVLETLRRSPAEIGDDAFVATGEVGRLQAQFVPALLETLAKARAA